MTKKKLTKAEMRVLIAKDVLASIAIKRFKPTHGHYLMLSNFSIELEEKVRSAINANPAGGVVQFSTLLKETKGTACVCALGAAALAAVDRFNKLDACDLTASRLVASGRPSAYLERFFSPSELYEIEDAFEAGAYGYYKYRSPSTRMKAIWANIVKNKGKFLKLKDE